MSLIFLDFDGALNSRGYFRLMDLAGQEVSMDGSSGLDPDAVARLNYIINVSGAEIVVSSMWRIGTTTQQLERVLRGAGLLHPVLSKTDDWTTQYFEQSSILMPHCCQRGKEIQNWLWTNDRLREPYVIIDDTNEFFDYQQPRFVQTDFDNGLLDKHVDRVLAILHDTDLSDDCTQENLR